MNLICSAFLNAFGDKVGKLHEAFSWRFSVSFFLRRHRFALCQTIIFLFNALILESFSRNFFICLFNREFSFLDTGSSLMSLSYFFVTAFLMAFGCGVGFLLMRFAMFFMCSVTASLTVPLGWWAFAGGVGSGTFK